MRKNWTITTIWTWRSNRTVFDYCCYSMSTPAKRRLPRGCGFLLAPVALILFYYGAVMNFINSRNKRIEANAN